MQHEMVTVKHIGTRKLTKDTTRLVFEIDARSGIRYGGELIVELRWIFGKIWKGLVGEYYLPSEVKQQFHVDIPSSDGKRWRSFHWVLTNGAVFYGEESCYEGKGKKNSEYANLR